jgi:ATP phosphoribosyltransferase regulatory subunit
MTGFERQARAAFEAAGATHVELPILQQADTLLDLYGEDIRGRAYTARDPLAGELMLRPDFTVPVVEMHIASGQGEARYTYAGKVFRMQELGSDRPSEHEQIGLELFGGDPAGDEAEVFAVFADLLKGKPLRVATGDIGVLRAAVEALDTSAARRSALLRHLWRPGRFRKLLDRFTGQIQVATKTSDAPHIGLRSPTEIAARQEALMAERDAPPISSDAAQRITQILAVKAPLPQAADKLQAILGDTPELQAMRARIAAMASRGVDVEALVFEGSYGRTNMEYYDGFVFGFFAAEAPMPAVATGGRYDALCEAMGRRVPAVGGVVRPSLLAEVAA